jgi:hypothetical protein
METKITRIDESEARVDFSDYILISYQEKSAFEKDLQEVIERYAI